QIAFGDVQHLAGDHVAAAIGSLRCGVEGVSALKPVERTDRRSRLERIGGRTRIVHFNSADLGRARGRRVDRGAGTLFDVEAKIALRLIPDARGTFTQRIFRAHGRGQYFVVDLYDLGRILRLIQRFSNDERDAIADVPDLVRNQDRVRRTIRRDGRK